MVVLASSPVSLIFVQRTLNKDQGDWGQGYGRIVYRQGLFQGGKGGGGGFCLPGNLVAPLEICLSYYIQRKISFRATILYNPCPNLEGIKRCALLQVQKTHDWSELLCRMHKRGCQGLGAIEMHSRTRASGASAARFDRPARQATKPRAKREAMSVLCYGLVVDLTFKRPGVKTSPLHNEFELQ